jgi:adenylate cyclase
MTPQEVKRKLTAILSADVKGYSRLMGEDEVGTIRTLNIYKEVMSNLIQQHHGRVVDAPGDNLLAEFASVVDAVQCAVEIQKELKTRNAELPENRRMEFRIGVNLGDVIEDGEQILGDGVNIAARLESLSEAGGVCISGTAFDQVRNKLELGYKYLGEQTVKNIALPVRMYKVLMEPEAAGKVIGEKKAKPRQWQMATMGLVIGVIVVAAAVVIWRSYFRPTPPLEVASKEKMAFPLPDVPSIAVLPFVNMSGDPKQEFFSDGLTEDIITALSKHPKLFVVARNSTFTYKGKSVKVQQVAEDLGVRYVIEGSVQRSGDRVRITAQLIDALKGHHIWSERYDKELRDIFVLQDKITLEVMSALDVKLSSGEGGQMYGKGTDNLEAYLKLLQARELAQQWNKESQIQARELAEEAIRLDPQYPAAYHWLAGITMMDVWLGISKSPKDSLMKAIELAQKATSLNDSLAGAHSLLGFLYVQVREHEKGIAAGERALERAPNSADAHSFLAQMLNFSGRPEEAIAHNEKAFRLNPIAPPSFYYIHAAHTYRLTARYEDAVKMCKELLSRWPNNVPAHVQLVLGYTAWGHNEEARAVAQNLLRIDPKFSAQQFVNAMPYKDPALSAKTLELMHKASLK